VQLLVFEARSENEIDAAFASLVRLHAGALVVASDPFFTQRNEQLVALADFTQPNGILLSPDEKKLYVIDTGFTDGGPSHIRVFDCDIETGKLTNGKVFADGFAPGISDGMRCDVDGNVWCSVGWGDPKEDGVRLLQPFGGSAGQDPPAGDVRQPGLWRPSQKPSVRLRQHLGLRALCGHPRRAEAVI